MRRPASDFFTLLASAAVTLVVAADACAEARHELAVGFIHYVPFVFYDNDGNLKGIDVDIAKAACEKAGCTANFVPINWHEKKKLLKSGAVDCIWTAFTINGRETDYQWTAPYLESRQSVLVSEDSAMQSLSDLTNTVIATTHDSKAENLLQTETSPLRPAEIYSFFSVDEIFAALSEGFVDAAASHESALSYFASKSQSRWRFLSEPLAVVKVGVAFDKSADPKLIVRLNEAFTDLRRNGTLRRIFQSYGYVEPTQSVSETN